MKSPPPAELPRDLDALQALVREQALQLAEREAALHHAREQHEAALRHQRAQCEQRDATISRLQEHINLLLARRYGASAETVSAAQMRLFNEAETEQGPEEQEPSQDKGTEVKPHQRRRPKRLELPEHLPRVDIEHTLEGEQRLCPHHGVELERFGEESCEQLDIVPAKIQVLRHSRAKYRCPCCTGHIVTAPMPAQPIPKSLASPGTLAHVAVAKYVDGLPLYRQTQQFKRIEVTLSRTTLANWMVRCGRLVQPLINMLRDEMLAQSYLLMDETTMQVLKEPGRAAESKSYLWVQMSLGPTPRILFDYDPSRSSAVPTRLLEGFEGTLHTDGYRGYDGVVEGQGLTRLYCWAHARRKFVEVLKSAGLNPKKIPEKPPSKARRALHAIGFIKTLYEIERRIKDEPCEERYRVRQAESVPVLGRLREWLDKTRPLVLPTAALGQALSYLDHHWEGLAGYCEDGRYAIDTNAVENAIRPFCVGRRGWLFSDSVGGAKSSANLYSLIETARANGLEPYGYLRLVFTELPKASSVEDIDALLPGHLDPLRVNPEPPSLTV